MIEKNLFEKSTTDLDKTAKLSYLRTTTRHSSTTPRRPTCMSVTDDVGGETPLETLPEFDLACLLEESEEPTAVTVYDPDSVETAWLQTEASVTVQLTEVR